MIACCEDARDWLPWIGSPSMYGCSVVVWYFTAYSSFAHKLCVTATFSLTDKDLFDRIYPWTVKVLVAGGETGAFFLFCNFSHLG